MIEIFSNKQMDTLINYPIEIIDKVKEVVVVLNDNYGEYRDVYNDLGGYVLIVESILDIKMLKEDKLKGLISEYTDVIEVSNGTNYTSSLYLLSSDFSILVITTEELSKFLLE